MFIIYTSQDIGLFSKSWDWWIRVDSVLLILIIEKLKSFNRFIVAYYYFRSFSSQAINESLNVSTLMPVVCSGAGTLIARYDEHALVSRFKFGVLHQRAGQVTEEQLFGNRQITPAFQEFLDLLGQKIDLRDHKGYSIYIRVYQLFMELIVKIIFVEFFFNKKIGIAEVWTLDTGRRVIRRCTRYFEAEKCCSTSPPFCRTVQGTRSNCSAKDTSGTTSSR